MPTLDPQAVLESFKTAFPAKLHKNICVVGSLAAAYHFRMKLQAQVVHTKDADLVLHTAGDSEDCKELAQHLRKNGWTHRYPPEKPPAATSDNPEILPFIRLYPPDNPDFFIEFLGLPTKDQTQEKAITPIQLSDGWFAVPRFRFMGLTSFQLQMSSAGFPYAAPWMMALANVLSHPILKPEIMSSKIAGLDIWRCSKDLGRVLALAWLTEPRDLERWAPAWIAGTKEWFPKSWREVVPRARQALTALMGSAQAMEQAHHTAANGLLAGKNITQENLKAVGDQLLAYVLGPYSQSLG